MNNSYKKAMDKIELSDELKEKIKSDVSASKTKRTSKFNILSAKKITGIAACFVLCFLSYYAVTNFQITPTTEIVTVDTPAPTQENVNAGEKIATNQQIQEQTSLKDIPDERNDYEINTIGEKAVEAVPPAYENPKVNNQAEIPVSLPDESAKNDLQINNEQPSFAKGKVSTEDNNDINVIRKSSVEEISAILGYEIQTPLVTPADYEVTGLAVVQGYIAEIVYQNENNTITYRTAKTSDNLSWNNETYEFMEIVNVNSMDVVLKGKEELYHSAVWSENDESFSITSDNGVDKDFITDLILSVDCSVQSDADGESSADELTDMTAEVINK